MARDGDRGGLDRTTLERLYVKLEAPMYNVVYRRLWSASEARDVVQEAFCRVWRARDGVDVATLEPLLYRTALNLASNRRRSARIWRWIGVESADDTCAAGASSEEALGAEQDRARVRAAIDGLPDRLRDVVLLTEIAELSYADAAATLGVPAGTIGSRRNAALARLAEALGGIEDA